jgi:signal transduction histidine kinase
LAYWAGAALWPVTDPTTLLGAVIGLFIIGLLHILGRRAIYGRAAVTDAALDEADRAASEQYVILTRTIERREHERLLHDTILNTLTALARAGGDDLTAAVNRCQGDVVLIEGALGGLEELAADTGRSSGDPLGEVRAVVTEMRARGLTVHDDMAVETAMAVPARVTTAISGAAREALSNVAVHAGTGEAWLTVRLTAREGREGEADAPGRLEVTVRDQGAGFEPAAVDPGRLGLRRSITERAADCGGQASIWSAPGQGAVVQLSWPASARPGEPDLADLILADSLLASRSSRC